MSNLDYTNNHPGHTGRYPKQGYPSLWTWRKEQLAYLEYWYQDMTVREKWSQKRRKRKP